MDLNTFFTNAGVEEFTEVTLTDLTAADQTYIREFFPPASSAIIFGRAVPPGAYQLSPADQTREMLSIAESLNDVAIRLEDLLKADGIPAMHIPLYLPVRIDGGRVQGVVRLKHLAAAGGLGTIGRNTLLLHPIHGPRLLLSGVITGKTGLIEKSDGNMSEDGGMKLTLRDRSHDPLNFITLNQQSAIPSDLFPIISSTTGTCCNTFHCADPN